MLVQLAIATSLTTPAAGAAHTPSLCVALAPASRASELALFADVVVALQARLAQPTVAVAWCSDDRSAPTWQVQIEMLDDRRIRVVIGGGDLKAVETFAAATLAPHEVGEVIALIAAETIRPALDELLDHIRDEPSGPGASVETLIGHAERIAAPAPGTPAADAPEPRAPAAASPNLAGALLTTVAVGLHLGIGARETGPGLLLGGRLPRGPLSAVLSAEATALPHVVRFGVDLRGGAAVVGVGAAWTGRLATLDAQLLARALVVHLDAPADVEGGWRVYWAAGIGFGVETALWSHPAVEVGGDRRCRRRHGARPGDAGSCSRRRTA